MKLKIIEKITSGVHNGVPKQHSIWLTLMQVYREFAKESSIHGIKYTMQAKTTTQRLFWLIVVIISLVSAGGLAIKFYERHKSGNMRTTVVTNQYPSLKIKLPTVTLCHGYLVSAKRLKLFLNKEKYLKIPQDLTLYDFENGLHYLKEMLRPTNSYTDEISKVQRILDANNMDIIHLLQEVSPNCSDLVSACRYEGEYKPCDQLFEPSWSALGVCCSFNNALAKSLKLPKNESDKIQDLHSARFGTRYILSLLLKPINISDRISAINFGDGYKVGIHESYTRLGPNALVYTVAPATENIFGLRGTRLTSSMDVLNLPRMTRNCKWATGYRAENCYMRCRELIIRQNCGCVPFFAKNVWPENEVFCNLTNLPCLSRAISNIFSLRLSEPPCNCLTDCQTVKYTVEITNAPLDAIQFKAGKIYKKAQNEINSTVLHITFAKQSAVLERRELVLSWINLISSLGGVFSLFLGCSFISVFEFIYFFFFQLIKKLKIYKDSHSINVQ